MYRFATVVCALVCASALAQEIGTEIPPGQVQSPPPSSGQPTSYDNPYGQPPPPPPPPAPGAQAVPA
ncbi:MAG: hypothetical protein IRZ16_02665, partial [Myxococcaceae bacterium]|nr:hypothetical protein [Myxococcaceae bacterium]